MSHENWKERALVAEAKIQLLNHERAKVDQRLANARADLVAQRYAMAAHIQTLQLKVDAYVNPT